MKRVKRPVIWTGKPIPLGVGRSREKILSNNAIEAENKLFVKLIKEYFVININDKNISSLEELQQDEYYNYLSFSDKIDIERYLFNS